MKLIYKIFSWIVALFHKKEYNPIIPLKDQAPLVKDIIKFDFTYCFIDELPITINENVIYVVGENEFYWMIGFNCPCGCRDIIQLNLLQYSSPNWSYKLNKNGSLSISPSVWRTKGCKSHFFIKNSRTKWRVDYQ